MKKLFPIILLAIAFTSCDEESQNQIANFKTVSQRIEDLGKSAEEIKGFEESAALFKEDQYLLEYEYPIREDESYVITYRFNNNKCKEIKIETYLNKELYAKKVQSEIMTDMANNDNFEKIRLKNNVFKWESLDNTIKIELNIQNIKRGIISLVIRLN